MSGNLCLVDGLRNNVTNFLSDELSLQRKFYQESEQVFKIPFKMYDEIKDSINNDKDFDNLANAFPRSGSDIEAGSDLTSSSALYSLNKSINPITYKKICVKLESLRKNLKLKNIFKDVADKDIRILMTDANKNVFYDSSKLKDSGLFQYEGNEGLNLPENAKPSFIAPKINECHVGRSSFTMAETSPKGFAVTTAWSGTLGRPEHRVCIALRNNNGVVGAILAISRPF